MYNIRGIQVLMLELLSTGLALNCTTCATLDYSNSSTNLNAAQIATLQIAGALPQIDINGFGTNGVLLMITLFISLNGTLFVF